MGELINYVPVRNTRRFIEAQQDEGFRGWLAMQEAAVRLTFEVDDAPGVRGILFRPESLDVAEQALLERFDNEASARKDESIETSMRFVYYFGETFRRTFEGEWAALPSDNRPGLRPVVDVPFRETFVQPMTFISFVLGRRTGDQVSTLFEFAREDYEEWVANGRPEREVRGTLTEEE